MSTQPRRAQEILTHFCCCQQPFLGRLLSPVGLEAPFWAPGPGLGSAVQVLSFKKLGMLKLSVPVPELLLSGAACTATRTHKGLAQVTASWEFSNFQVLSFLLTKFLKDTLIHF